MIELESNSEIFHKQSDTDYIENNLKKILDSRSKHINKIKSAYKSESTKYSEIKTMYCNGIISHRSDGTTLTCTVKYKGNFPKYIYTYVKSTGELIMMNFTYSSQAILQYTVLVIKIETTSNIYGEIFPILYDSENDDLIAIGESRIENKDVNNSVSIDFEPKVIDCNGILPENFKITCAVTVNNGLISMKLFNNGKRYPLSNFTSKSASYLGNLYNVSNKGWKCVATVLAFNHDLISQTMTLPLTKTKPCLVRMETFLYNIKSNSYIDRVKNLMINTPLIEFICTALSEVPIIAYNLIKEGSYDSFVSTSGVFKIDSKTVNINGNWYCVAYNQYGGSEKSNNLTFNDYGNIFYDNIKIIQPNLNQKPYYIVIIVSCVISFISIIIIIYKVHEKFTINKKRQYNMGHYKKSDSKINTIKDNCIEMMAINNDSIEYAIDEILSVYEGMSKQPQKKQFKDELMNIINQFSFNKAIGETCLENLLTFLSLHFGPYVETQDKNFEPQMDPNYMVMSNKTCQNITSTTINNKPSQFRSMKSTLDDDINTNIDDMIIGQYEINKPELFYSLFIIISKYYSIFTKVPLLIQFEEKIYESKKSTTSILIQTNKDNVFELFSQFHINHIITYSQKIIREEVDLNKLAEEKPTQLQSNSSGNHTEACILHFINPDKLVIKNDVITDTKIIASMMDYMKNAGPNIIEKLILERIYIIRESKEKELLSTTVYAKILEKEQSSNYGYEWLNKILYTENSEYNTQSLYTKSSNSINSRSE